VAAREHGLDLTGTLFRLGGEPLTPARAAVVASTGSRAASSYSMAELGRIGVPCAAPTSTDDLHLLTDKLAVLVRPRSGAREDAASALHFTTLRPTSPKLMINVETDDYAVVQDRRCGCLIGELGFSRHVHAIRSHEKLTSEGMTFEGSEVLTLVEETLPARFGGAPTDYQLVDEVDSELPSVAIVVSPGVGDVDEDEVVRVVLAALEQGGAGSRLMTGLWRDGGTLRVVRREPIATPPGKVLPIHTE
jgi:hypothetical protein